MRFIAILTICIFLYMTPCSAENIWGDLPLEIANEQEINNTLTYIGNITYFENYERLKYGEIYDVDIVDTNVLIAIAYNNITQIWLWNIEGEFLYGYELPLDTKYRSYALSADGHTVLINLGRRRNIIGLTTKDGIPAVSVYTKPEIVEKYNYAFPKRSLYQFASSSNGKVVVIAPDGEQFTIVDFTEEFTAYQSDRYSVLLPASIVILLCFLLFCSLIAWLIKNNSGTPNKPS